jgi:hypothetical protein
MLWLILAKINKEFLQQCANEIVESRRYTYDGGTLRSTEQNFLKVHKDYKSTKNGNEMMMVLDP